MKRSAPLKRTPFKSKLPPRKEPKQLDACYTIKPKAVACRIEGMADRMSVPVPKPESIQHRGYMNLVRAMACAHCNRPPRSVFCHSDEHKGMATKSDCRLGWPGCPACHQMIGTDRIYPRDERREIEADMARRTRAAIRAAGAWPKNLPEWKEE